MPACDVTIENVKYETDFRCGEGFELLFQEIFANGTQVFSWSYHEYRMGRNKMPVTTLSDDLLERIEQAVLDRCYLDWSPWDDHSN